MQMVGAVQQVASWPFKIALQTSPHVCCHSEVRFCRTEESALRGQDKKQILRRIYPEPFDFAQDRLRRRTQDDGRFPVHPARRISSTALGFSNDDRSPVFSFK